MNKVTGYLTQPNIIKIILVHTKNNKEELEPRQKLLDEGKW